MPTYRSSLGITRFEDEQTHPNGFMVRMCRKGKRFNEFFSDSKFGNTKKAKKAAEARYEELLKQHGPADMQATKNRMTARNSSGQVGVHLAYSNSTQWPNSEYYAYCASWVSDEGSREKISFGFNRYGEDLAYEMACHARKYMSKNRSKIEAKFAKEIEAFQKSQSKDTAKSTNAPPKSLKASKQAAAAGGKKNTAAKKSNAKKARAT